MDTLSKLESLDGQDLTQPFKPYEEEMMISLALDHPDFFLIAARFIKPDHFGKLECKWIMAEVLNVFEKSNIIPTRAWLRSHLEHQVTEADSYEEIFRLVDRKSDPRETPLVKESLLKWSKDRAYGMLYTDEAMEAYHRGDFQHLESIVQDANRIAEVGNDSFWFFDDFERLFLPDAVGHMTTGFPRLDHILNNGGPSRKEVLCWLAATNMGKSILLCNNAISSLKSSNDSTGETRGEDVLLITFELDTTKTAMRCLAATLGIPIAQIADKQDYIRRNMESIWKTYGKHLVIHELPPDECSVSHIYALLDSLKRTKGWKPNVVIIDYMDLMVSRNPSYNKDDYTRLKHVANEVRGLARNEDVLIFTATQTNRSGAKDDENVDLTKAAESFGKQFSLDYIVSLNQTESERNAIPSRLRFYVAKNRNGPKLQTINCEINYDTMVVRELL